MTHDDWVASAERGSTVSAGDLVDDLADEDEEYRLWD
jgi:hypothetical protein